MNEPQRPQTIECDTVIIGAGPAGCAAAAIVAEAGHEVVILERESFPRYRVGESLIPYCWFPLERLGVLDQMLSGPFAVEKRSVQFVNTEGELATPFYFTQHTDHDCARTWQVRRDQFDQMLLDNALRHGATIVEQTAAKDLIEENDRVVGVRAKNAAGETIDYRAPMTVDASGRDMFAVSRTGWRMPDPALKKIAIWTYFKGAQRDCGIDAGATTVAYLPDKGWFWYIPLPDDTVSVGVVAERDYLYRGERDPQRIFDREVELQPWIKRHLAGGTQHADMKVTGDYSYRSKYCAKDGMVLVGDAFSFLDPVFSSGVMLALQSGVMAGDAISDALENANVSAAAFEEYSARLCSSIEAMRQLVFAFYDQSFSFGAFIKAHPEFRSDLTDCLIGNLELDFKPLFTAVSEFADLPDALTYGRPMLSSPVAHG